MMRLGDDRQSVIAIASFAVEGKLVGRLAVGHLVDAEPFDCGGHETGHVLFNIFNIYEKMQSVENSRSIDKNNRISK